MAVLIADLVRLRCGLDATSRMGFVQYLPEALRSGLGSVEDNFSHGNNLPSWVHDLGRS